MYVLVLFVFYEIFHTRPSLLIISEKRENLSLYLSKLFYFSFIFYLAVKLRVLFFDMISVRHYQG